MRKNDHKTDNTFTIAFHNIPKDEETLGRAIIGLQAAGLNVQFLDSRLRNKADKILKNKKGSFSTESFYQSVLLIEVS